MSNKEFHPSSLEKITVNEIEEKDPGSELTEEVRAGVGGFIMLMTACVAVPLLVLTIAMLIIFPLLALVGIILLVILITLSLKNLHEFKVFSED